MGAWLLGRTAGPILGAALACALVALLATSLFSSWKIGDLQAQRDMYRDSIIAPRTGYAAQMATCQANGDQLSGKIGQLGDGIKALSDQTTKTLTDLQAGMKAQAAAAQGFQRRAAEWLALPKPAPEEACTAAASVLRGRAP